MSSQRQIEANRRNAAKSTGPKTPQGREAVRRNALTHGLTAEILLPLAEEEPAFQQLWDDFHAEYQPSNPTEQALLESLIAARWRLSRIPKMEAGFFALRLKDLEGTVKNYSHLNDHARLALVHYLDCCERDTLAKLSRYETRLERSFYKALKELQRLQAQRADAQSISAKQSQSEDRPPRSSPPPAHPPAQSIALVPAVRPSAGPIHPPSEPSPPPSGHIRC